jgi:hypothetical protein
MSTYDKQIWLELFKAALTGAVASAVTDAIPTAIAERARKIADAGWKQWERKQMEAPRENPV